VVQFKASAVLTIRVNLAPNSQRASRIHWRCSGLQKRLLGCLLV